MFLPPYPNLAHANRPNDEGPRFRPLSLRVRPKPVSFEGDVPIKGHRASSRTAYVEGMMHIRVQGLLSLWVAVDIRRRAVVGIDFYPTDFGSLAEVPKPTIERKIVQAPKPAGGPDSGCREYRD